MNERLNDKIKELETYLTEMEENVPDNLEDYLSSRKSQLVCERLFEIITETIADIAFIFIKDVGMAVPDDDESALLLLADEEVISHELGNRLREMRRMRNIVAHKYGNIDNSIVFNAIGNELVADARALIAAIRK